MVQCYKLMFRIAVTLHSNFLHLVTSSRIALVSQVLHYGATLQCYVTCLYTALHVTKVGFITLTSLPILKV